MEIPISSRNYHQRKGMGWSSSRQLAGHQAQEPAVGVPAEVLPTPAKHSKLCFCPKVHPAAAPFVKAELAAPHHSAPGCRSGFCS